jgi:hypothetical protein
MGSGSPPRPGSVQRRGLAQAGAALVDVRRHWQGAGGAARHRLRKARHAQHRTPLRRPGMAHGTLAGRRREALSINARRTWNQYTASPALALAGASAMTHELPPTIDPVAAARWAALSMPASAGPSGEAPASAWLHEEVARRMEDRLAWIKLRPQQWAHWEAVRGGLQAHAAAGAALPGCWMFRGRVQSRSPATGRDVLSKPWWHPGRWKAAPTRFEAPPEGSLQMLWANMAAAHGRPAGPDRPLAPGAGGGRLSDVLLPWARHRCANCASCTAHWAGRRQRMRSPTCTTGATCWCRPALPSR